MQTTYSVYGNISYSFLYPTHFSCVDLTFLFFIVQQVHTQPVVTTTNSITSRPTKVDTTVQSIAEEGSV